MAIGKLGMPRRSITFMYAAGRSATLAVAGYGLATRLWGLMRLRRVERAGDGRDDGLGDGQAAPRPGTMLGRVSSLDWFISIGLLPLSFALTGPVSPGSERGRRWSAPVCSG